MSSPAAGVLRLNLSGEVCLTAFIPREQRGALLTLAPLQTSGPLLEKALATLSAQLGQPWHTAELKLVGPATLVATLETYLTAAGVTLTAVAKRPAGIDLLFYPGSGRLRLAAKPLPSTSPALSAATISPAFPRTKHRLLIVDDSPTIQRLLSQMFAKEPDFLVVGVTGEPRSVPALIAQLRPDVMTLDIHMPGMDGIQVLREVMPRTPIPTVMITSLSLEEGGKVLDALAAGAVDYMQKPALATLQVQAAQIIDCVRGATTAHLRPAPVAAPRVSAQLLKANALVVIGSSTGGTEALRELLTSLPETIPPVLIVQHIPAVFSAALAQRLHGLCPFEVKEAADGDEVRPNRVLIAPGDQHMRLALAGDRRIVRLDSSPPHNRHRPAVDLLFQSAAQVAAKDTLGILLTGMGADGAQGLLALRNGGAKTIAQDEKSCVVFGMPREAIKLGAAQEVLPLQQIGAALMKAVAR